MVFCFLLKAELKPNPASSGDIFNQAKKNKVAFADLLVQEIQTAQGESRAQRGDREGRRRRR